MLTLRVGIRLAEIVYRCELNARKSPNAMGARLKCLFNEFAKFIFSKYRVFDGSNRQVARKQLARYVIVPRNQVARVHYDLFGRNSDWSIRNSGIPVIPCQPQERGRIVESLWMPTVVMARPCMTVKAERYRVPKIVRTAFSLRRDVMDLDMACVEPMAYTAMRSCRLYGLGLNGWGKRHSSARRENDLGRYHTLEAPVRYTAIRDLWFMPGGSEPDLRLVKHARSGCSAWQGTANIR